jgi:hypothetical protein
LQGPYQRLYDLDRDSDETTDLSRDPGLAPIRAELLQGMYERLASTLRTRDRIPSGLSQLDAIHWCLTPKD